MRLSILIAPLLVIGGVAAYAYPSEYDTFDNGLAYLSRRSPGGASSKAALAGAQAAWKKNGKKITDTGLKMTAGGAVVLAEDKRHSRKQGGGGGGTGDTGDTGNTGDAQDKKEGTKIFNTGPIDHGGKLETDTVTGKHKKNSRRSLLTPEEEHYFLVARHVS